MEDSDGEVSGPEDQFTAVLKEKRSGPLGCFLELACNNRPVLRNLINSCGSVINQYETLDESFTLKDHFGAVSWIEFRLIQD